MRSVDADFRLAVTGTPFENRLMELWSLLSITTPGLYPWPRRFRDVVVRPVEKDGDEAALRLAWEQFGGLREEWERLPRPDARWQL